ncbi:MAG: DUF6946 family protein [Gemmatimonadaceae bacterium]
MSRIVSASLGTAVWRAGLADPYLHWRRTRSAWELAVSWEARRTTDSGLPPEVHAVLNAHAAFRNPRLLVGIVEHRVALDTAKTPSQNDLWCMVGTDTGQASVAVEGKAGEEFDRRLDVWLGSDGDRRGKDARLRFLCEVLGANDRPDPQLRYQLFHRAASAVLEAERWGVGKALMMVQSFAESPTSWQDYVDFAAWLGVKVSRDSVSGPVKTRSTDLYLAWVHSDLATDALAATAV